MALCGLWMKWNRMQMEGAIGGRSIKVMMAFTYEMLLLVARYRVIVGMIS